MRRAGTGTPVPEKGTLEESKDSFTSFVRSLASVQSNQSASCVQAKTALASKWIPSNSLNRTRSNYIFKQLMHHVPYKNGRGRSKTSKANYRKEGVLARAGVRGNH